MLFLLLLALCLLVYLPGLYATPIWDDIQLFRDPKMPKWKLFKKKNKWVYLRFWMVPRWLTQASFGLTFRFFQRFKEEWQHTMIVSCLHLTNILIHWINCLIVYAIASLLVGDRAIVAALLFAVHPLAASTVAPIISRSSLLSSTFIFLAVWATLAGHPFIALFLAVGAFGSKEDGIAVFPLIIALTAFQDWKLALEMAAVCLLILHRMSRQIIAIAKVLLENNGDIRMEAAGLNPSLPQPTYTYTAIVENLKRWPLWMIGFERNPDPDPKPRGWPLAVLCLLLAGIVGGFTGWPIALIVFISPWSASWFFRLPDPVSELRAYSTILAMVLLLSYVPMPLVMPLVVWFAALAAFRAWLQQNEMALWRHAWNEGSRKLRVAINLAAAYQKFSRLQEAFDWHQQALKIAPDNGLVLTNLALWFEGRARMERQNAANTFVANGTSDQKAVDQAVQQANQFLAQAVILAREGMKTAGNDPWVKHYYQAIEAHAMKIGLQVQVVNS